MINHFEKSEENTSTEMEENFKILASIHGLYPSKFLFGMSNSSNKHSNVFDHHLAHTTISPTPHHTNAINTRFLNHNQINSYKMHLFNIVIYSTACTPVSFAFTVTAGV